MKYEKSDAQLDAEAFGPQQTLAERIEDHRHIYQTELKNMYRLHDRFGDPGGGYDPANEDPKPRAKTNGWGQDATGMPYNQRFRRYLELNHSTDTPWSRGLYNLWVECRRSHDDHKERPEWRGSLCHQLVGLVVRFGWSYSRACYDLHLDPDRTEDVMHRALRRIEHELDELQARATSTVESDRGRHDFMAPPHEHRALGGAHEEQCENPVCRERRAA